MLTRRQVLSGTAAGSIAAIASAHGIAAAPAGEQGFDAGFGTLQGGAAVAFHKVENGFSIFLKLDNTAAQVFYKEEILGQIGVFLKSFIKMTDGAAAFHKVTWTLVDQFAGFLKDAVGAEAGFYKVTSSNAQIFLKYEDPNRSLAQDVRTLQGGLLLPSENSCAPRVD